MSITRTPNRVKTEINQDSNMLHYLLNKQQTLTLSKRRSIKNKTIRNSLKHDKITLPRKHKQSMTMKAQNHLPLINSIEEEDNEIPLINNKTKDILRASSYLTSFKTTSTSRNIISPVIDFTPSTAFTSKQTRRSLRYIGKNKTTIRRSIPKSILNNEDVFNKLITNTHKKQNDQSEITKDLLLQTQMRILNRREGKLNTENRLISIDLNNERIPVFNTTGKLNNYLISQYHLNESNTDEKSKRKMKEISDETFENIKQKKNEVIRKNNKMAKMISLKTKYIDTNDNERANTTNYTNDTVNDLMSQYYSNRQSEKVAKANKFLHKLEDLSNHKYQSIDKCDLISYSNLSRVIKVMKLKDDAKKSYCPLKKKKLKQEEDEIILATYKLGYSSNSTKGRIRSRTEKKFKGIQGVYFGVPV